MQDSVESVSGSLDHWVLLNFLAQVKSGDFTARMPVEWTGTAGKIADGLNDLIIANQIFEAELGRVSWAVGREGKLSERVALVGATQSWSGSVESVNRLIEALVRPASEMQRVIDAVAGGDLSKEVSALTDAAPMGIFRTDADNKYVYTNPRWSELTGVSAEDALGRAWHIIVDGGQQVEVRGELPDGARSGTSLCQRFELTLPNSDRRIVLATSKSIVDADGATAGWVGTLADVTAAAGAEAASANARTRQTMLPAQVGLPRQHEP